MKKNKHLISIGVIILGLFFLSRQPFLARTMSNEDKLLVAIENTINAKRYTYHGKLYTQSSASKVSNESIEDSVCLEINGNKQDILKDIKVGLRTSEGIEDIFLCHYYEDKKNRYLITPFKSYEKLIFKNIEIINTNQITLKNTVKSLEIEVENNKPLKINQGTYDEININTDYYQIEVDLYQLLKLENIDQDKISNYVKEKEILKIDIRFYIDEGLYIRKIEGVCKSKGEILIIELYFDSYGSKKTINIPDIANAQIINEPLENWLINLVD